MKKTTVNSATASAVSALLRCETDSAFVGMAVQAESRLLDEERDRRLAVAIAHGAVEKTVRIDYAAGILLSRAISSLAPHTRAVLRAALYQLMYMERPAYAVVNEAVTLGKHQGERALLNAVLRRAASSREALFTLPPREKDDVRYLSLAYSMPRDKVRAFIAEFGIERTETLLASLEEAPHFCLRVNTVLSTRKALIEILNHQEGVTATPSPLSPDGIRIEGIYNPAQLRGFEEGLFFVQDEASQLALRALSPKPHTRTLDTCAGLGGKTFSAAALMEDKGEIVAADLYERKLANLSLHAASLHLQSISFCCHDACAEYPSDWEKFDFVITDVPCSGLGVIRRKPDLRHRPLEDTETLTALQGKILANGAKMLKSGGRLLYSTCTLRSAENHQVVNNFLLKHPSFSLTEERTLMPDADGCDGFYYAILTKSNDTNR